MDILVIGSLNMDLIIDAPRMPAQGETILGSGFQTAPGGKGANQAVAAARLAGKASRQDDSGMNGQPGKHAGTHVRMIGCLGTDSFGDILADNLMRDNVDTSLLQRLPGQPTGVAVIVLESGNNRIIVAPGANTGLFPERMDELEPFFIECGILLIQLEIPLETVERAITLARRHGVMIILNPAPARMLPDDLLKQVDVLTPNESECAALSGLPSGTMEEAGNALLALLDKGVPRVIVTLGASGVLYNKGRELVHRPVPKVPVVDTTAAGDSFSGALAVAFSEGMDIDTAIDFANAVGTLTVMKAGAQPSLPTREDVESYMNRKQYPVES
jgi:ribokinase